MTINFNVIQFKHWTKTLHQYNTKKVVTIKIIYIYILQNSSDKKNSTTLGKHDQNKYISP